MRRIKINWMELEVAIDNNSWEIHYYLDLETGEVIAISDETRGYLDYPPGYDLPDWQQQELQAAEQVERGYGTRYTAIPRTESHDAYRDMERFIGSVWDERLQNRLWRAIQGRGAFRYFKDVLHEYPAERERWFAFSDRRIKERMLDWLESENIEPTNPIELPQVPPSEGQERDPRDALLEELTLLVIYLASWEEDTRSKRVVRRAWRGYVFEVLDELERQGLIKQRRGEKSLVLTEAGVQRAQEIEERVSKT
jgi:hypothetical protein